MENTTRGQTWAKTALRVLVYLLAVLLVFLTFSVLCAVDTVHLSSDRPGEADLTDFDFAESIAEITNESDATYRYPGAFYTSEDFASGSVTQAGALTGDKGDYGTLRILLHLPADGVYAISGKSVAYAQTIYVDGVEIGSVGVPADNAEDHTPMNSRFMEAFYARGETTEIIIHYAVFIHADGGGVHPIQIGTVANIARAEQLRTLFEGVLSTALFTAFLFFFGLFLFFRARRYFLWFALLCGCVAVLFLGLNNNTLLLMLPKIPFTVFLRLGYMGTCWAGLFGALYLNGLFPGAANRRAVGGFVVYCTAVTLFIALAPTTLFTRYPVQLSATYAAFLVYQLAAVVVAARRGRLTAVMTKTEGILLLGGMAMYIVFGAVNIWTHQYSVRLFGWESLMVGVMVFLFLNVLALALLFARTEGELEAARAAEREIRETNAMLERLNQIRTGFLENITHEMKTPLAVMGSRAGNIRRQIHNNTLGPDAEAKLTVIEDEAVRLGELVDGLLNLSMEQDRQLTLSQTDAETLLDRAADFCAPLCQERRNRLTVDGPPEPIPLRVDEDRIFRVLLNLIENANRQAEDSEITLTARRAGEPGWMAFAVTDRGGGVQPELLNTALQRGVTGDGGAGLGLAICKEIVQEHGGEIDIENTGDGARVRFTLPTDEGGDAHGG